MVVLSIVLCIIVGVALWFGALLASGFNIGVVSLGLLAFVVLSRPNAG